MRTKLRNLFLALRGHYRLSPFEESLAARLRRKNVPPKKDAPTLTIEAVEDPFFYSLFGEICVALRQQGSLYIDQLIPRSFQAGTSTSLKRFLTARLQYNAL